MLNKDYPGNKSFTITLTDLWYFCITLTEFNARAPSPLLFKWRPLPLRCVPEILLCSTISNLSELAFNSLLTSIILSFNGLDLTMRDDTITLSHILLACLLSLLFYLRPPQSWSWTDR